MADQVQPASPDDLIVWPDGTYCFRHDLAEYTFMGDDRRTVAFGSAEWERMSEDWE